MAATKRKMDFTNVKEGGNFRPRHKKAGDYLATIVAVDDHTSREGNEGWVFTIKIKGDERSTYPVYAGADEKQAWKMRKLFIACGRQVPKKLVMVDPNKLVGSDLGVFLDDDEYEGRMRSRVEDYMPIDDVTDPMNDDDDTDDEEPPGRRSAVSVDAGRADGYAPPADDDDDPADDGDDDEPAPPPRRTRAAAAKKTTSSRRRAAAPPDDDDDLDLDEL